MSAMKSYLADMDACKDMSDVCELAHNRTVGECERLKTEVNCDDVAKCGDDGRLHGNDSFTHYTGVAQDIFNHYYDEIINHTGL